MIKTRSGDPLARERAISQRQDAELTARAWGEPSELADMVTTCPLCHEITASRVLDVTGHAVACPRARDAADDDAEEAEYIRLDNDAAEPGIERADVEGLDIRDR